MDQYLGEIRLVGFTFAPVGWLFCNGQLVSVSDYEALYTLLGTTYGGDGVNTFGLPNLQGRAPIAQGTSRAGSTYSLGQAGGVESVTLNANQNGAHMHGILANSSDGTGTTPQGNYFGSSSLNQYESSNSATVTTGIMLTASGGNQSHENRMPYQVLNYIIATEGIYPSFN